MTEAELQHLLADARANYRIPPEPPLDDMWKDIEARAFQSAPAHRRPPWTIVSVGLAAALVLGVALGRLTTAFPSGARSVVATADSTRGAMTSAIPPLDRTTSEVLGRTAVLLSALPNEARDGRNDARFSGQAAELLVTTRLLLDSPAASDARLKALLEDLELVLVQVARLRDGRNREDLELITDALEERNVVPRLRTAVAQLSRADD